LKKKRLIVMQNRTFSLSSATQIVSLLAALSMAPDAFAEIFKCVDKATGKVAFTDHACPDDTPGKSQPVGSTNVDTDSGAPNKAGTQTVRKESPSTGRHQWVDRAVGAGNQQKTGAPEPK
jgi:hypothetical protein